MNLCPSSTPPLCSLETAGVQSWKSCHAMWSSSVHGDPAAHIGATAPLLPGAASILMLGPALTIWVQVSQPNWEELSLDLCSLSTAMSDRYFRDRYMGGVGGWCPSSILNHKSGPSRPRSRSPFPCSFFVAHLQSGPLTPFRAAPKSQNFVDCQ